MQEGLWAPGLELGRLQRAQLSRVHGITEEPKCCTSCKRGKEGWWQSLGKQCPEAVCTDQVKQEGQREFTAALTPNYCQAATLNRFLLWTHLLDFLHLTSVSFLI